MRLRDPEIYGHILHRMDCEMEAKDVHESGSGLTRIRPTGTGGPKGLTCDRAWIRGKRVRYDRDP